MLKDIVGGLDLLINYKQQEVGGVRIAIHKSADNDVGPYQLGFSPEIAKVLRPELLDKPLVIVDMGKSGKTDNRHLFGRLDTTETGKPFKTTLFGPRFYQLYNDVKSTSDIGNACHEVERQVLITLIHEKYHYIARFVNNSVVQMGFMVLPQLNAIQKQNPNIDKEEIFCEFMANLDAQEYNDRFPITFTA